MRSVGVVLESVLLSQQLGLLHRGEQLNIQELIPEPAVECLHKRVLPGGARWDVSRAAATRGGPLLQGIGVAVRLLRSS
jgi:hypothetical protein